jgi:uncharacterized protein YndB with AHSA1/START domain
MTTAETRQILAAPIRKSLLVRASRQRAFDVFIGAMHGWWPMEHSLVTGRSDIVIEPEVGGRWYEVAEDGSETQWGKVLAWEPPERVVLAWQLSADFTYDPAFETEVEVRFLAEGDETRVEFEHRHLDRYGAEGLAKLAAMDMSMDEGWGDILSLYAEVASAPA